MSLYHRHLQTLVQRYNEACAQFGLDAIVLHAGELEYYTNDDHSIAFKPAPWVQQWLPYDVPAGTWVVFSEQDGLHLYWPAHQDFWHVNPEEPSGPWTQDWNVQPAGNLSWLKALPNKTVVLSPTPTAQTLPDALSVNPADLTAWLAYDRAVKTEWEIENIRIANQRAARGHVAAEQAFHNGMSELDIHRAYLIASDQQQIDEPYGAIVALNEAAAILHYERKNQVSPQSHRTLLIDAGAKVLGYASDITRTFQHEQHGIFAQLLKAVDEFQQELVAACTVGTPYLDIHNLALQKTAQLLKDTGICSLTVEDQLNKRIPQVFFPHGIGHYLGLQVHDVGGHQIDRNGTTIERPEHAPFLRLMRNLEENVVVTIEPGLYFIPMLLEKMKVNTTNHGCDFKLIDELTPFGGIRIEDDVVVKREGPLNLSRASFSELA